MSNDNDNVIELDSYEPNYANECECCGACGTVMAVKDGKVVHDWGVWRVYVWYRKSIRPCMVEQ